MFGAAGERVVPVVPIAGQRTRTSLESLLVPASQLGPHLISTAEALADTIAQAVSSSGDEAVTRIRVVVTGEALAGDTETEAWTPNDDAAPAIIDTLSVVLSNTGGSLELALGALGGGATAGVLRARPEPHRRTRRGKQRRRAEVTSLVQPKLFKS